MAGVMRTAARAISSAGHLASPIVAIAGRMTVASAAAATSVPAGGRVAKSTVIMQAEDCPAPRHVFGPAPTVQEAREAVSGLVESIETNNFSSPTNIGSEVTRVHHGSLHEAGSGGLLTSLHSSMGLIQPSATTREYQVFSLIQRSPEVQNLVASLASDRNIWDAVLKNDQVMEFCKSYQNVGIEFDEQSGSTKNMFTNLVANVKMKISNIRSNISDLMGNFLPTSIGGCNMKERRESERKDDNTPYHVALAALKNDQIMNFYKSYQNDAISQVGIAFDEQSGATKNVFMNLVANVKMKISNIRSNVSDFMWNFLPTFIGGGNMKEGTESKHEDDNTQYYVALAVAVIMIIVFKRI